MVEKDPIDLIKDQLNRIDELIGLHYDHETFIKWHSDTKMILEKAFGSKSIHYQNFLALRFRELSVKTFSSPEIEKINSARYKKDLENCKSILQSAIKELTIDRTLFKKIQSKPQTVEVSLKGKYYISSGVFNPEIIRAIESAFEGSGLNSIYGFQTLKKSPSLKQRISQIKSANFGIYDLSSHEKDNTILELGIALGLGKEAIIIFKKGASLPERIEELKIVEYENPSDLNDKLKKFVLSRDIEIASDTIEQ
jgi:hypothetical protein